MKSLKNLVSDSLWLLFVRGGTYGAMVVVTYVIARRMGVSAFGEYAFIAAVVVIGNVLTTFGSDMVLIREIAAKGDLSDVLSALILQLILSTVFIGCVFLFGSSIPGQTADSILALKIYSFALIPLAFFTVITSILRGMQRMTLYALLNFGVVLLQVTILLIFIKHETRITDLAYILLAVQVTGALFMGLYFVPLLSNLTEGHFSLGRLLPFVVVCLPVALISILGILYQKLGLVILTFLGTSTMAGIFSASAKVMEVARLGHIAFFTVVYPVMANLNQREISQKTLRFSLGLMLIISSIGSILIFILSKSIIEFIFGSEYRSSILVLKILAFTLIPYTVNSYLSLAYMAMRREIIVLRILAVSLLLLLLFNLGFVPILGSEGAGWAILVVESIQTVIFILTWMKNPVYRTTETFSRGGKYEFSDLS